jgi:divalent metal cation (Fe/Co/Zn/Cd) transporter
MADSLIAVQPDVRRRVQALQWLTLGWMSVEVVVGLSLAFYARSLALLAFSGDSVVEMMSACLVLWRFQHPGADVEVERRSARLAGTLLYALAAAVALASALALLGRVEPRPSYAGVVLLIAAALIMPWLGRQKRALAVETHSAALRADSVQSSVCAWLAWIGLAGLAVNAIFGIHWADPLAALAVCPLIIKEAREARRGEVCGCC